MVDPLAVDRQLLLDGEGPWVAEGQHSLRLLDHDRVAAVRGEVHVVGVGDRDVGSGPLPRLRVDGRQAVALVVGGVQVALVPRRHHVLDLGAGVVVGVDHVHAVALRVRDVDQIASPAGHRTEHPHPGVGVDVEAPAPPGSRLEPVTRQLRRRGQLRGPRNRQSRLVLAEEGMLVGHRQRGRDTAHQYDDEPDRAPATGQSGRAKAVAWTGHKPTLTTVRVARLSRARAADDLGHPASVLLGQEVGRPLYHDQLGLGDLLAEPPS